MNNSKVLLGVVAGMAAGAVTGLLMAPDSGAGTRQKISDKSRGYMDNLRYKFNSVLDGIINRLETVETKGNQIAEQVISTIGDTTSHARDTISKTTGKY